MTLGPVLLLLVALAPEPGQQPPSASLVSVNKLYAAADYEAALSELDRLAEDINPHDRMDVERYRALCYLALGRNDLAEAAIEQMLRQDPDYEAGEQEPPRVRAAFAAVRTRLLPELVRTIYTEAKAKYDRKEHAAAVTGFERTVRLLDSLESADPALADLRTLAAGFLDLSRAAGTPATTPPAAPARDTTPRTSTTPLDTETPSQREAAPRTEPAPETDAPPAAPTVTARITPPEVISQVLPPWNPAWFGAQYQSEFRGALEVAIDEAGTVTAARVLDAVHPAYDQQLLEAAKQWRYVPGQRNGKPVASTKRVDIVLRPRE
jgi:periplasmic protein TonB